MKPENVKNTFRVNYKNVKDARRVNVDKRILRTALKRILREAKNVKSALRWNVDKKNKKH